MNKNCHSAQSTIEYALLVPLLFFMILGIMELAFLWHAHNSVRFATQGVVENVALSDCTEAALKKILVQETGILHGKSLTFGATKSKNVYTFTSNQSFSGNPLVKARIDCKGDFGTYENGEYCTAQLQSVYILHFFAAAIPNLKTGKRIEIIPNNVVLTSTKNAVLKKF